MFEYQPAQPIGLDGEKWKTFWIFSMENTWEKWKKSNHPHQFLPIYKLFRWSLCLEGKVIFVCHWPFGRGRGSQCLDSWPPKSEALDANGLSCWSNACVPSGVDPPTVRTPGCVTRRHLSHLPKVNNLALESHLWNYIPWNQCFLVFGNFLLFRKTSSSGFQNRNSSGVFALFFSRRENSQYESLSVFNWDWKLSPPCLCVYAMDFGYPTESNARARKWFFVWCFREFDVFSFSWSEISKQTNPAMSAAHQPSRRFHRCGDGRFAVPNGRTKFGSVLAQEFGDAVMLGRQFLLKLCSVIQKQAINIAVSTHLAREFRECHNLHALSSKLANFLDDRCPCS